MAKLTIEYPDNMEPSIALGMTLGVIKEGRISGPENRKQFCYVCTTPNWAVYSGLTKAGTDSFKIRPNLNR
jgi:hypothetical protein